MTKVTAFVFYLDWKQRKLKKSNVVSLKAYKGLAEVAVKSLCELLVALPHFNFHNNIIVLIVPLMNDGSKLVGFSKTGLLLLSLLGRLYTLLHLIPKFFISY